MAGFGDGVQVCARETADDGHSLTDNSRLAGLQAVTDPSVKHVVADWSGVGPGA